jgi:hypothetical protein
MPTETDPVTGKTIRRPYPGEPGFGAGAPMSGPPQPTGRPAPPAGPPRRQQGGRPPERQIMRGPGVPAQDARVGPELGGDPAGLGHYGASGAVPGVAPAGAVTSASVLPHERRRRGVFS